MKTKEINRGMLGIAAEYAVASKLCLQGIYAQLTLGNQKKTDLLVFFESGRFARIEVKAKQGKEWPNCKGISGPNAFIVFVDYMDHSSGDHPDFFILDSKDWLRTLKKRIADIKKKHPDKKIDIEDNVAVFSEQIGKSGRPYKGMSIRPDDIKNFKECWEKIANAS